MEVMDTAACQKKYKFIIIIFYNFAYKIKIHT